MNARMQPETDFDAIPLSLRQRRQWVCWKTVATPGERPRKVPFQPDGRHASHSDMRTWVTFEQAVAALGYSRGFQGVGFVFTSADPYCGIDLDGCFSADGTLKSWAVDIVAEAQAAECYLERSPSGLGLHIIGTGVVGAGRKRAHADGAVEIYDRDRYFTMSGEQLDVGDVDRDGSSVISLVRSRFGLDAAGTGEEPAGEAIGEVPEYLADQMAAACLEGASGEFLSFWSDKVDVNAHGQDRSAHRLSLLNKIALKLGTQLNREPAAAEIRAVALRSQFIRGEIRRGKWPRLAAHECALAVKWARENSVLSTIPAITAENRPYPDAAPLTALDLAGLAGRKADPPEFIIPGWLPRRMVTLLSSHGSGGKSQIALVMSVCLAAGRPWMGIEVPRQKVLVYSCEDDRPVLEFRLQQACAGLGIEMRELAGWLHVVDATEADNIMYTDSPNPLQRLTAAYGAVSQYMTEHGIQVAVIDNASDVFAANEINRAHVKDFIAKLKRLATLNDGAVLLLGHASKDASKNPSPGQMYSGSTAWHNSVRSRWELTVERKKDERQDDGLYEPEPAEPAPDAARVLTCVKSNYGEEGMSRIWRWNFIHLILLPDEPRSPFEVRLRQQQDDKAVLRALAWCEREGVRVTTNRTGSTNFQSALKQSQERLAGIRLGSALQRLCADGLAEKATYRKANRTEGEQYVVTGKGYELLKK